MALRTLILLLISRLAVVFCGLETVTRPIREISVGRGVLHVVATSNNLFVTINEATITQYDTNTGLLTRTLYSTGSSVSCFSITDPQLVAAGATIDVFDISVGSLVRNFTSYQSVTSLTADNGYIYAALADFTVQQIRLADGASIKSFYGHTDKITAVMVQGASLFSVSLDGTLRHFNISNGQALTNVTVGSAVNGLAMISTSSVFTADDTGWIKQWTLPSLSLAASLIQRSSPALSMTVLSLKIYCGFADGSVIEYALDFGSATRRFVNSGSVSSIAVTDTQLFAGLTSGKVTVWDILPRSKTTSLTVSPVTPSSTSSSSPQIPAEQGVSAVVIAVVVIIVLLGIMFIILVPCIIKRKLNSDAATVKISQQEKEEEASKGTASSAMTNHTLVATTHELSIPAFMQMRYGVDFKRGEFLAKGGGGQLYKCESIEAELVKKTQNTALILKVYGQSMESMSEDKRYAFLQEISLLWSFRDHPSFIRFFAYSDSPPAVVMKHYTYGDLKSFVHGKGKVTKKFIYSKKQMIDIYKQFCDGIAYMHENGIVHCDIKPSNVLLHVEDHQSPRLLAVIGDLGVSRVVSEEQLRVMGFKTSYLRGASVFYAAPDVFFRFKQRREETDPSIWKAADRYALGVTLLEMLIRMTPWKKLY